MSRVGGTVTPAYRFHWVLARRRRTPVLVTVVGALIASMLSAVVVPAAQASADNRPPVSIEKPIPHTTVPLKPTKAAQGPPTGQPTATSWPAPGDADLTLGRPVGATPNAQADAPHRAGTLPILIRSETTGKAKPDTVATTPPKFHVHLADHNTAVKAGVAGVLFAVTPEDTGHTASVGVDYSGFRNAVGADFGTRLHLVQLPACALSTPDKPECHTQTPIGSSTNDSKAGIVSAPVTFTAAQSKAIHASTTPLVLAATAGSAGPNGSFTASSLAPSGSWSVGGSSGAFTWSYPIATPPSAAGGDATPKVALSYDSSRVDGHTASTNNQTSWIGEGWDYSPGYIERTYRSCADDPAGTAPKVYDACWSGQILTMNLDGHSVSLVLDDLSKTWHTSTDTGDRVELLTGSANGALGGEYWKITTPNGTQYFFGRNSGPGHRDQATTNSTWTEPVYGAHPGDPCNNPAGFAASSCAQAWRWNLDYVEDPHGNATMYYYTPETNYYGANNSTTGVAYTRGGYLSRIDYGLRDENGTVYASAAADQVVFTVSERCLPSGTITCDPSQFTTNNAASWPDTPQDQHCVQGASCDNHAPSIWSTKRLTTITTQYYTGTGYTKVDTYELGHQFYAAIDASMWLASITHTGYSPDGTSIALPAMTFTGQVHDNRVVNYNNQPAMIRWRLATITTETGQVISISYSDPECTQTTVPADPANDTMRCFPVRWVLPYNTDPVLDYFHMYVTTEVDVQDANALSPTQKTTYRYLGSPAWHFDDNEVTKPANRTYGQFRGYQQVEVRTGDPQHSSNGVADRQTLTRTTYYRGMDGDTLPGGKIRTPVTIADSLGESVPDSNQFAGTPREVTTFDGDSPAQVSTAITDVGTVASTASRARDGLPALTATIVATTKSRTLTALAAGGARTTSATTAYDSAGRVTQQTSSGDGVPDVCTTTSYADNTTSWIRNRVAEVITSQQSCPTPGTTPSPILSDVRTFYDNQTNLGVVPGAGDPTRTDSSSKNDNGILTFITTGTATFDGSGRPLSRTDALNRTSTTAYTPTDGGVVTQIVTTNPKKQTTKTLVDPGRGSTLDITDVAGHATDASYDALGRLTAMWLPGHSKSGNQQPSSTYSYLLRRDGASAVTSKTLIDYGNGTNYTTSVTLYDGLGHVLQTQSDAEGGGRIGSDTVYDSHGWVVRTNNRYHTDGAPGTTLISVADADVNDRTVTTFDGDGRPVKATAYNGLTATWATQTVYGGDRTTTIPPPGGVTSTTLTDSRGKVTELRQYTTPPTISGNTITGNAIQSTLYHYTPLGQQDQITDAEGNKWTYTYDLLGRRRTQSDPDAGSTTYGYDDAGQLTSTTDNRGQTLAFKYDELGRKLEEHAGSITGPELASWVYDTVQTGKLSYSTRYTPGGNYLSGVTGYDGMGLPNGTILRIPASETGLAGDYTTSTSYTTTGLPDVVQPASGGGLSPEQIVTSYDALGKPKGALGYNSYASGAIYTPYGEIAQFATVGGNGWLSYDHDKQTRRVTDVTLSGKQAPPQIDDTSYTYDPAGNLTSSTDVQGPPGAATQTQCFGYDALDRLNQAWTATDKCAAPPSTAAGSTNVGGITPYWTSWSFQPSGLRATQVRHALPGASGDTTTTYTYPAPGNPQAHTLTSTATSGPGGNTATSYGYDAAGNTSTRNLVADRQTLSWDQENRLASDQTSNGTSTYVYDADGNLLIRHDKGSTTLFLPGEELTYNATLATVTGTRYYSFGGNTIAMRVGGANPTVLAGDSHGTNQIAYQPETGEVTRRAFDPYGNPLGSGVGTWPDTHGFLNKPVDQTSGLTEIGARNYDPMIGRFISVDPVLDPARPGQLNGYTYANDNPTTLSDPTGLLVNCGPDNVGCGGILGDPPPTAEERNNWWTSERAGERQRSRQARDQNWIDQHSPATTDNGRLQTQLYHYAGDGSGDYWTAPVGDGRGAGTNACFGRRGCQEAYDYLLEHPDDVEGAKRIAAMYCIDHLQQCATEARVSTTVNTLVSEAVTLAVGGGFLRGELGCAGPNSFAGDTPVLMADGTNKPIDQVKVGDQISNAEPDSPTVQRHTVTAVHITDTDHDFTDVTLATADGPRTITSTTHHLFWDTTTHTWTDAGDLKVGQQLDTPGNGHVTITSLRRYATTIRTYNLTIDGVHTYYVLAGDTPVLVHNTGCWSTRYERAGDLAKRYTEGQSTRDPASQWYHEELGNDELLHGINNAAEGDGIVVSRNGTILGGHHRWDELQVRINDGRINPDTSIRIDVYGGE